MMDYVWLIPLFPFIGFLINGLLGKSLPKGVVGTIGSMAVGLSFLVTVGIFCQFLNLPPELPRRWRRRSSPGSLPVPSWRTPPSSSIPSPASC